MINYPETLPAPLIDGSLSWSEFNQRIEVKRWAGPPVTVPAGDYQPAVCSITILCTKEQLDAFVSFYKTDLDYGANWFFMDLYSAGQVFNQEVNFLGNKPSVTQINKLYRVSMNLTTRIAFQDSQDVSNAAIQFLGDGYKYISELPVGEVTFDSTDITWDSTIIFFDNSTNPFY